MCGWEVGFRSWRFSEQSRLALQQREEVGVEKPNCEAAPAHPGAPGTLACHGPEQLVALCLVAERRLQLCPLTESLGVWRLS